MSREINNIINNFRKAREEGTQKLEAKEITFEQYSFVMLGFEEQLKEHNIYF